MGGVVNVYVGTVITFNQAAESVTQHGIKRFLRWLVLVVSKPSRLNIIITILYITSTLLVLYYFS